VLSNPNDENFYHLEVVDATCQDLEEIFLFYLREQENIIQNLHK